MNIRKDLITAEVEALRLACNFTPEEREIFDLLTRNNSVVQITLATNTSQRTAERRIHDVKQKVERAWRIIGA